jgi:hypothetical protein
MAGSDLSILDQPGNVRISIEPDTEGCERIVFRKAVKIEIVTRTGSETVGVDKGASIALTATNADAEHAQHFGPEAGSILLKRTSRQYRRRRSQFSSQADNLNGRWTKRGRFHGNPKPTPLKSARLATFAVIT